MGTSLRFPIGELLDEDRCYAWWVEHLHPEGLHCPNGHERPDDEAPHTRDRASIVRVPRPSVWACLQRVHGHRAPGDSVSMFHDRPDPAWVLAGRDHRATRRRTRDRPNPPPRPTP